MTDPRASSSRPPLRPLLSSEERHLEHVKAGDHKEYARRRREEKEAEARALRGEDDMSDPEGEEDLEGMEPETEPEGEETEMEPETEPEGEETEMEPETEPETEPEEGEEGEEGDDDEEEEEEEEEGDDAPGSDKFSDRPRVSPDRPDGVPKLNIKSKRGKKGGKKKRSEEEEEEEEEEEDGVRFAEASPDRRPPGRRRGETMRKLHRSSMRSARGYRSSEDELTDGLEDDEYGGYTARSAFDGKTEYRSLQDAALGYGKETMLGKDGMEHRVEDLPIKMAFEHLSSLAGMGEKVQDAINLSKSLFQRRVERMDKGVLHKAWRGWLLVQLGFQKKKNILARAVNKLRRRKLALAFNEWASHHGRAKKVGGMGGAARQVVINGMRRRTFRAWREKAADSRRQMVMAGNTAKLREEFLERLVEVGLRQLVHKRMRKAWTGFDQFSEVRRGRRNRMRQAIARATKGRLSRAFQSWDEQATLRRKQRGMVRRAIQRMRKGTLARCFDKWREADRHKKRCLMRLAKGKQARAFARWQSNMALLRRAGIAFDRWADRNRVNAFRGWAAAADRKREQTRLCEQILKRMLMRGVRNAWKQWCWVVEDATGCSLDHVRALKDQNARLRRDNERFVRLVDSGEWGRGRVEELAEAGRVLRDERRQLEELIKNIKTEKEGFVRDAQQQAAEARGLKDRLVSGNFVQRNKMTVRGGSSFNTIQRVLKQDLLDTGAASRNPQALHAYRVDRMALDKVSVFSDGEINVQATRGDVEPFTRSAQRTAPTLGGSRGAGGVPARGGGGGGGGTRGDHREGEAGAARGAARGGSRPREVEVARAAAGPRRAVHARRRAAEPLPRGGGRARGAAQAGEGGREGKREGATTTR